MALRIVTGFEHGAASTNGGGLWDIQSGSPSVQSTVKRTGEYALSLNNAYVQKSITATNEVVLGVAVRFPALSPDSLIQIIRIFNGGSDVYLYYEGRAGGDQGKLRLYTSGSSAYSSMTVSIDTWYWIDIKIDGTAQTGDWQINEIAQSQISTASSGDYDEIRLRCDDSVQTNVYDDLIVSDDVNDYPFGPLDIIGLSPDADGSHNAGTDVIEDQAGADIGVVTAYNLLDEVPMNVDTDYVRQAANGTGNYAELEFEDIGTGTIKGVMGVLAYDSAAVQANEGACVAKRDDDTEIEIWGTPASPEDYSESSLYYKSAIITPPGGGWTQGEINALRMRIGYSGDANPDPHWQALMFEVAYVSGVGHHDLVVPDVYHVLAADPIALTQIHTLAVPDVFHALAADPIALTQAHTLAVTEAFHVLAADPIVLTQNQLLVIQEAFHVLAADPIVLTQAHLLTVTEAFHLLAADPIALTQAHALIVPDVYHGHLSDNVDLIEHLLLVVADSFHAQTVDPITLSTSYLLVMQEAFHALASDPITLSQLHNLTVPDVFHALDADPIAILQAHQIAMDDAFHALSSDPMALTQAHVLAIAEAFHILAADPISLSQIHELLVNDAFHVHLADNITLVIVGGVLLVVQDSLHGQTVDGIALNQAHSLSMDSTIHAVLADLIELIAPPFIQMPTKLKELEDPILIADRGPILVGQDDPVLLNVKKK